MNDTLPNNTEACTLRQKALTLLKKKRIVKIIIEKGHNLIIEKLSESEEAFRTLADSIPQFVWVAQADATIEYYNQQWTEYTGLTMAESYGSGWITPFHPEDKQLAQNAWQHAIETGENYDVACRLRQYDGEYHWFIVKAEPLRDNLGNIIKWYGTCTNIDSHKQTEKEIKKLNEELEIKVNKRTFQLQTANNELVLQNQEKGERAAELIIANKELAFQNEEKEKRAAELVVAKDRAKESDRLKSAFLANMSHEIRTPMNGILGFTELLKSPNLTGERKKMYISMIEKSGDRLLNIINDIISISQVESGQMEISISETNINEQIDYIYSTFHSETEKKGILLSYKKGLPNKEVFLKTDCNKVYAILTNLIKNAIKFTQTGSIIFGYEKKDKYLEFFVKDTGVGIRPDLLKIVFERFKQGSESLTRNYEGAGLGLSIAKAYVKMFGGKIWAESEERKGSTFYFTIPYNAEPLESNVIKNIVTFNETDNRLGNFKILIAEDDESSAMLQKEIVGNFSRDILLVMTGIEAIAACHSNPDIDLILMDLKMPVMDGYEATRQIRLFNKEVIIIAQTAYAFSSSKEKAIAAGCNEYISKPINKALMIELIKKNINKS